MTRIVPVTLVIADAGPLISLAVVDRLDLLQAFGTPVFVTDAVMYECTAMAARPGSERLREWFASTGGNQHRIINTPFGAAYRAAEELVAQGHTEATKNFGEWATSWAMQNIDALLKDIQLNPGMHCGLILSEDKDFLNDQVRNVRVPRNTHLLSTRAFFVALERLGIISTAQDLSEAIKLSGRPGFSKSLIDRPFRDEISQTDYARQMIEQRDQERGIGERRPNRASSKPDKPR